MKSRELFSYRPRSFFLSSVSLRCLESFTCIPPLCFFPFLFLSVHLRSLSLLLYLSCMRGLSEGMGEEERVCRPGAWKDSGKQRKGREGRGGERKSKRPITPSEHLKLLAGLSSAAALISPPISANPTGLPWTRWTVKTHLFSLPLSLLLNFLHSFVPGLHSLSALASFCTENCRNSFFIKNVGCKRFC